MALAILHAEGILAEQDGRSPGHLSKASRAALATAPAAERWARIHLARLGFNAAAVQPSNAAKIVALAVDGIARACIDDPEERLVRLLRDAIDVVATFAPLVPAPVTVAWAATDPPPTDSATAQAPRTFVS